MALGPRWEHECQQCKCLSVVPGDGWGREWKRLRCILSKKSWDLAGGRTCFFLWKRGNFLRIVRFSEAWILFIFHLKRILTAQLWITQYWHLSWDYSSITEISDTPVKEAVNRWPFSSAWYLENSLHMFPEAWVRCNQEHLHRNWRQMFASRRSANFRSNVLYWKGGSLGFWRKRSSLTTAATASKGLQLQCHATV